MLDTNKNSHEYLRYLEVYLKGDLKSFHQRCSECEVADSHSGISIDGPTPITSSMSQGSYGSPPTSSSSTTTSETTRMPAFNTGPAGIPSCFRSTIPHALTLFAAVDTLGFLSRFERDFTNTQKNFTSFFEGSSITPEAREVLLNVYRHGMAHGYFPKLGLGISYHTKQANMPLFFKNASENLVLNVNELEKIVIAKLDAVIANPAIFPHLESQYNFLEADYEAKTRQKITDLEIQVK